MSRICSLLLILLLTLLFPLILSASTYTADSIAGLWEVEGGDAHIRIFRCAAEYCGTIAWLKEPVYPPGDKGKMPGKPLQDRENPNRELRNRPLIGLQIMDGYTFQGSNLWDEGRIYNTENGKTYSSRISMKNSDRLKLRGYIGIPLLGGSTEWKRVK